jgi:multidrug efflux pump
VSLAQPKLPDVIKQTGVTTRKRSPDILMSIALYSPNRQYDQLYMSNYALLHVKEEIARVPGVGDISMFGQRDYSMRIWVDPEKLSARDMTAGDVVAAIREQNMPVATGQIGQPPIAHGQAVQISLSTMGRLVEPAQFGEIIVKCTPDGRMTRIKDIARVELGAKNEDAVCQVNHLPAASIAIFQLPDANALETAERVIAKMDELRNDFPPGLDYQIRYDTTPYIRESINEVFKTLREAVILVAIVVLLFLQNWRSAVIPLIAVPVAIVGTFAVMAAIGFSLNTLTLFGLVLAIGIVVDDAIVVVEAVEHHIEHGLSPRDATIRAMEEVSGPVIAIGLVLTAVFVPCAFITGITGQFFRQFALTIATSTLISAFNSLTLSPALAALLLRPREAQTREVLPKVAFMAFGGWLGYAYLAPRVVDAVSSATLARLLPGTEARWWAGVALAVAGGAAAGRLLSGPLNWLLSGFFRLFNAGFNRATNLYTRIVGMALRLSVIVLLLYGGMLFLTYKGFMTTPKGFIPSADMGYLMANIQLPDSASAERTVAAMDYLETICHETPGVRFTQAMSSQSLVMNASSSNFATMFIVLDNFDERPVPLTDRAFRLLDLDANQAMVRKWFKWSPDKKPDLEARVRKWLGMVKDPKKPSLSSEDISKTLSDKFAQKVPEAVVRVYPPPPVRGVGRAGGFNLIIEDRGDLGSAALQAQVEKLVRSGTDGRLDKDGNFIDPESDEAGGGQPSGPKKDGEKGQEVFRGLFSAFRANVPQIYADVNRTECMTKEVDLKDLFESLRVYLGSLYVNDFNRFDRTWQVIVQADSSFRRQESDVKRLKVRNVHGTMLPVVTLADFHEQNGPLVLTRYNMYPSASINGSASPGISSGQAIKTMGELAGRTLPPSMAYEWTELAFFENAAGNTAMKIFVLAVVMVFLVLAAQYESWSLPLAVILVVPLCLLSAIAGVKVAKEDINIFTQIGFVVLVGLASKNAILIVEFAKYHRDAGESRRRATLEACRLRLRPIVMTSMAFILGVLPLLLGHGAGAEMRRTLGTTVFSGMLGVTIFGIFLTPVFFFVIDWLGEARVWKSPLFRWANTVVLGGLSLRPLRLLIADRAKAPAPMPGTSPDHETTTDPASSPSRQVPVGAGMAESVEPE